MATVSEAIFSDAFSWMFCILMKISLNFVPTAPIDNGLAPNRRQVIIWTNADPIHWRVYAAPGGDEFKDECH